MNQSSMKNMAAFKHKFHAHCHTRSVSLPARSHPSTVKIDQAINKIKTWEANSFLNADKIFNSLYGLKELYEGIEELLAIPLTQRSLAQHQHDGRINELLDESVGYIDICSNTRETIMLMKEGIRGLQSAIRRSKIGELSIEKDVTAFMGCRKNFQKEISMSLTKLKHSENRTVHVHFSNLADHQSLVVLRGLMEASHLSMSIFSSLLLFLSLPITKSKPTRWLLVSKLMQKGVLVRENEKSNNLYELESVDMALNNLLLHGSEKIESVQRRLERLETMIESLENGLEVLFRHLIPTRVSLLNILSQ